VSHDPTTNGASKGPWRLLVLDRTDRTDPKWVLATVTEPGDVRPAAPPMRHPAS
jgi:hypothetical protein